MEIRKTICENLSKLSENKNKFLYDYIKNNNISHTENKNGLFINISLCDEKHIDFFNEIINLNDKIEYNENKIEDNKICIDSKDLKQKVDKKIIYKNIKLTKLENLILKYSFE